MEIDKLALISSISKATSNHFLSQKKITQFDLKSNSFYYYQKAIIMSM